MGRVKFNVNTEYAYIQNFKILQSESSPLGPSFAHTLAQIWPTFLHAVNDFDEFLLTPAL